jgi:predicted Zn-dependent peptidase
MRIFRFCFLFCFIACLVIPSTLAFNLSYQSKILPNGIRIVYKVLPKAKTAAARVIVPVGFLNESRERRGISHLLEHLIFRGNERYTPETLRYRVVEQGGSFNGSTTLDRTEFYFEIPAENLIPCLSMYVDLILNPGLTDQDIALEKKIVNIEKTLTRASGNAFFLYCNEITQQQLESSVNSITREDLVQYHQKYYKPNLITVVLTGAFNPDEVSKFFSGLTKDQNAPSDSVPLLTHETGGNVVLNDYLMGEEYQLLFGFDLKQLPPDALVVAKVLPFILEESRQYDYLNDRSLDYQIFLYHIADRDYLVFMYRDCREKFSLALSTWHQKNLQRYFKYLKAKNFDKFLKWKSNSLENYFETFLFDPALLNEYYAGILSEPTAITPEDLQAIRRLSSKDIRNFVQKYLEGKSYQKVIVKAL